MSTPAGQVFLYTREGGVYGEGSGSGSTGNTDPGRQGGPRIDRRLTPHKAGELRLGPMGKGWTSFFFAILARIGRRQAGSILVLLCCPPTCRRY